jgi:hypothetical protein
MKNFPKLKEPSDDLRLVLTSVSNAMRLHVMITLKAVIATPAFTLSPRSYIYVKYTMSSHCMTSDYILQSFTRIPRRIVLDRGPHKSQSLDLPKNEQLRLMRRGGMYLFASTHSAPKLIMGIVVK